MVDKKFIFSLILFFLSLFCMQAHAQTTMGKNVVMVTVSNLYPTFPPSILRLVIKPNSIERFLDDPVCISDGGNMSCDFDGRKGELINCPEDLLQQMPREFLEKSNDIHSSLNDGGGSLIIITFDDGSRNVWGIFQPEEYFSPEVQEVLKKINSILTGDVACKLN